MNTILLHLGAHRTATTFVQKTLQRNVENLLSRGVSYRPIDPAVAAEISALDVNQGDEPEDAAAHALLSHLRTIHPKVIVSWEGFLGRTLVNGRLYGDRAPYLRMLRRFSQLAQCEVRVSFAIRRQDEFLTSWYAQLIKAGAIITPADFFASVSLDSLGWTPIIDDIRRVFPDARIVPYEYSREDRDGYLRHLLSDVVELHDLRIDPTRDNPSYNAAAAAIARFANEHANFSQKARFAFRNLLLSQIPDGAPVKVMDNAARRKILQTHGPSTQEFLRSSGWPQSVYDHYGT